MRASLGDRRTRKLLLTLLVVAALINLPLLHQLWTDSRVEGEGVDVTVPLVASEVLGEEDDPRYWVSYRLPEDLDPRRGTWPAEVDRATYDHARETGDLEVRVLRDDPAAATVEGEVRRRTGLWTTVVADAVLAGVVLLVWRVRRREGTEDDDPGRSAPDGGVGPRS